MSLNQEIADLFASLARLMEVKGENTFKVIAFQKVGRTIEHLTEDLRQCVADGTLGSIEGVGKSSREIIEEYVKTGKSTAYNELAAAIPAGLIQLLEIEGLGPKTIHLLWKSKGITSPAELGSAIAQHKLDDLKGFGAKKIANLAHGLELYNKRMAAGGDGAVLRRGIGEVIEPAEALLVRVQAVPGILHAELAGSYRRRKETIADIDIVAATADPSQGSAITGAFIKLDGVAEVISHGLTRASVKIANGMQADLRVVPEENYGAALLYFTGSKEHNVKIRSLAQKKGLTLNEWGLYRQEDYERADKKSGQPPQVTPVACKTEAEIYAALGLEFVEPPLREDLGEVELALAHELPVLMMRGEVLADLHTHTTASDGEGSIEQMIEAAIALGFHTIAITDHSKTQVIANGLSPARLVKHIKEIHKAAGKYKEIQVLAGSEVDILADGTMDYEDKLLAELDIVIASPHMALRQAPEKATDRLKRAIEHRYVNIIGHPTGRLINRREGISPDFSVLFPLAAACGTAMEINASYPRLDLNDQNARAAIAAKVVLSINTDAHSPQGVGQNAMGVDVARRAGATKENVLNCWVEKRLREFLKQKR